MAVKDPEVSWELLLLRFTSVAVVMQRYTVLDAVAGHLFGGPVASMISCRRLGLVMAKQNACCCRMLVRGVSTSCILHVQAPITLRH